MFAYQKRLQFPINIKKKDLKMAKFLLLWGTSSKFAIFKSTF